MLDSKKLGTFDSKKLGTFDPQKLGTFDPKKLGTFDPKKLGTFGPHVELSFKEVKWQRAFTEWHDGLPDPVDGAWKDAPSSCTDVHLSFAQKLESANLVAAALGLCMTGRGGSQESARFQAALKSKGWQRYDNRKPAKYQKTIRKRTKWLVV